MKIQKIEIHDFRGLSDVAIDNLDKNLNLLMGVNGAGKSSVLDAIALLLQPFTARLTTKAGAGFRIDPDDIKKRSRRGCTLQITLDDDNKTTWSTFRSKSREVAGESNTVMLTDYTLPMRKALDNYDPISLPVIAHYGVNRSTVGLPLSEIMRRSMKMEKYDNQSDAYRNWYNRGAIYRDFLVWFKETEGDENRKRIENPEYRDRGLEAIRSAIATIFPEYENMHMLNGYQLGVKKNGEEYPFDILSDGEKCYITLVCDIVRRLTIANPTGEILKGEGIVLIDEVDLHLHPSWEATVMEKLNHIFENIQFIVSAHSPLVASHFDGQVYGVRNGEVTALPRLFGLNYSTILQDWMQAESENKEMAILADLYKMYRECDMLEQAEEVWQKILVATGGDVSSPYFLNLRQE